jgi:hypothetical protein
VLKVVHDAEASNENAAAGGSLLDEIVGYGARAMLAAALQAEVAAYIEAHKSEVDEAGHRLVVRNGYHAEREVTTAAGVVPVRAPRVNDKRIDEETGERRRFSSAILPAWARKSPQVAAGGRGVAVAVPARPVQFGPEPTSVRRWGSSLAPRQACPRPRSPGSPRSGKMTPRRSRRGH